jgi:hypothetical protein
MCSTTALCAVTPMIKAAARAQCAAKTHVPRISAANNPINAMSMVVDIRASGVASNVVAIPTLMSAHATNATATEYDGQRPIIHQIPTSSAALYDRVGRELVSGAPHKQPLRLRFPRIICNGVTHVGRSMSCRLGHGLHRCGVRSYRRTPGRRHRG